MIYFIAFILGFAGGVIGMFMLVVYRLQKYTSKRKILKSFDLS